MNLTTTKEGVIISDNKSRAEYFRDLRKKKKQLVFMVDNDEAERLDTKLNQKGISRIAWFREKLLEEINDKSDSDEHNSEEKQKSINYCIRLDEENEGKLQEYFKKNGKSKKESVKLVINIEKSEEK